MVAAAFGDGAYIRGGGVTGSFFRGRGASLRSPMGGSPMGRGGGYPMGEYSSIGAQMGRGGGIGGFPGAEFGSSHDESPGNANFLFAILLPTVVDLNSKRSELFCRIRIR